MTISTYILFSIVIFLGIIFLLVGMLLGVKAKLVPSGPVKLLVNGENEVEVSSGNTLLSTLSNNKIFLRIIAKAKFEVLVSNVGNLEKFKVFLKTYNLNEKIEGHDSDFYKLLRDIFSNSRKVVTRNVIKNKADEIIQGCVKNIKPIDDQIDQSIKNWRFDRINSVDLNILRIAVFEILFSKGIPVPVSIKEAIVLALKYSSDESCGFINGILDTISKRALQ